MILYHGSNLRIKEPKIIKTDKGRDFGFAFYLTPIKEQAERWAIRRYKSFGGTPIVSVFEWNEDKSNIKYKYFDTANEEWLDMILNCRSNAKYKHTFVIVEGKVADDMVGETVLFVLDGVMRKEDAIKKLKFQKINSQIAFCSEKSLKSLTFLNSYKVKL